MYVYRESTLGPGGRQGDDVSVFCSSVLFVVGLLEWTRLELLWSVETDECVKMSGNMKTRQAESTAGATRWSVEERQT